MEFFAGKPQNWTVRTSQAFILIKYIESNVIY